jgi:hypothetical protein
LLFPIDQPPSLAAGALAVAAQPLPHLATTDASHQSRSGDELRSLRGGGDRNRTDDLLLAKQALSQLSYTPSFLRGTAAQKY